MNDLHALQLYSTSNHTDYTIHVIFSNLRQKRFRQRPMLQPYHLDYSNILQKCHLCPYKNALAFLCQYSIYVRTCQTNHLLSTIRKEEILGHIALKIRFLAQMFSPKN